MSARRIDHHALLSSQKVTVHSRQIQLTLSPSAILMHTGGIEFRSAMAFPSWTEMTMVMESVHGRGRLNCNGVVISCTGNKHAGYHVSMVFTSLSRGAQDFFRTALASGN